MKNVYVVKDSPTDAQWNDIMASPDRANRLAALREIDANASFWSPTDETDITTGIPNEGPGGSAVCSGMTPANAVIIA